MICDPRDGSSDNGLIQGDQQHGYAESRNDHQKFDAFGVDYFSVVRFGLSLLDNCGVIIDTIGVSLLLGHVVNTEKVDNLFDRTNKIDKTTSKSAAIDGVLLRHCTVVLFRMADSLTQAIDSDA
jgi:hypothetical protein